MKKMIVVAAIVLIALLGFYVYSQSKPAHITTPRSMWIVDWQREAGLRDVEALGQSLSSVSLFGLYYNAEHDGFLPESTQQLIQASKNNVHAKRYLTVVNDQITGTKELKSEAVIEAILANPKKHQQQIITFTKEAHVDGVELDYENIPADKETHYLAFIRDLQQQLHDEELALRVVLEPSFSAALPDDIEFIVMAYNLHGPHSDAGPKADFEFLDHLAKRFSNDAGNITIALSLGGFRFAKDGVTSLTEQQIEAMKPTATRHDASAALSFTADDGAVIWYNDAETIKQWTHYMQQKGYTKFAYWRAGSMSEKTHDMLKNLDEK